LSAANDQHKELRLRTLPEGFQSIFTDCGEVALHVVHNARAVRQDGSLDDDREPLVLLHGFPEYWACWRPVMEALPGKYLILVPDQRGYNRSDAPPLTQSYAPKKLVSDLLALTSNLIGGRHFLLAGHDWGAAVAYAAAMAAPERIKALVIINGVHPLPFQKALAEDPAQQAASQYFHYLRAEGAEERLSENGYRRLFGMFEKFSPAPWLSAQLRADYVEAWSQPGRLEAMLNWYRASPILVPKPGETLGKVPLLAADPERFQILMPHLLIFGMRDVALQPSSHRTLGQFAPKLERLEIGDGDHWILHTHGERIAREIDGFIGRLSG
jgi:pimeloyl-ACP methyl ester carboxylesterase